MIKLLRRLHLLLGVFFTPILLVFIATGWYQTVNTQRNKTFGEAETWFEKLSSVHVDSILPSAQIDEYAPALFRWFVVAMSIALILTTLLGVAMAFKFSRSKWLVVATLAAGFLLPAILLWLGQIRN